MLAKMSRCASFPQNTLIQMICRYLEADGLARGRRGPLARPALPHGTRRVAQLPQGLLVEDGGAPFGAPPLGHRWCVERAAAEDRVAPRPLPRRALRSRGTLRAKHVQLRWAPLTLRGGAPRGRGSLVRCKWQLVHACVSGSWYLNARGGASQAEEPGAWRAAAAALVIMRVT